jgi:hypothetical protein
MTTKKKPLTLSLSKGETSLRHQGVLRGVQPLLVIKQIPSPFEGRGQGEGEILL